MSATGLDVFDRTLQATNIWLDEIMRELGPDRQVAWAVRDRLQIGPALHLGAQLPGLYYDQWRASEHALKQRSVEAFLDHVSQGLTGVRPVNVQAAAQAVFRVLNHHVDPRQGAAGAARTSFGQYGERAVPKPAAAASSPRPEAAVRPITARRSPPSVRIPLDTKGEWTC